MDKILILYSNPIDTPRIRLDKEHKAIDQVIDTLKIPTDIVTRRHATSFKDLVEILSEGEYSIVQFSTHGTTEGIYLEGENSNLKELITAHQIASLLQQTQPNLKLAIFLSCFSAAAIPELINVASYLLTVFGFASDQNSIEFIQNFYKYYFKQSFSIERACSFAQLLSSDKLQIVMSRRAFDNNKDNKVLFQIFPLGDHFGDSFLVDISEAEPDINSLVVSREKFLSVLSRKIRLHRRIFNSPRERAILPIGEFIGIFSWQHATDVIICHRILKVKPEIDEKTFEVWARITVVYNDMVIEKYRLLLNPAAPSNDKILKLAIDYYNEASKILHRKTDEYDYKEILNKNVPEQYKITKSLIGANLEIAERRLYAEDFPSVVSYLEIALSSLHDLINELTAVLAIDWNG